MENDNDPFIEGFFKDSKRIALSRESKGLIEKEILQFIKNNPLQKPDSKKVARTFSELPLVMFFKKPHVRFVLAAFLIVGLVGDITITKAALALPGDFLYPMKIGFNEKLRENLAFSMEDKANVQLALAESRLKETEQLMAQGKLTQKNQTDLETDFKIHIQKTQGGIARLRAAGNHEKADQKNSDLEASLRAHQIIISQLQKNTPENLARPIQETLAAITQDQAQSRISILQTTFTDANAANPQILLEKKSREVETTINAVKKILKKNAPSIADTTKTQSENNLRLVQEKISQSENQGQQQNSYQKSVSNLQEADILAKETKKLLDAKHSLHLNEDINIKIPEESKDSENTKDQQQPFRVPGL